MSHLTLEAMQEMFDNISTVAGWDMATPKLYGYFFFDQSAQKLGDASYALEDQGFRMVNVFVPELEEGEPPFYVMHVERVEVHTPASLHALNQQLEAFAQAQGIEGYDGVDVGPLPA